MPENCRCEILRTTEELESIQPEWLALWSEDRNATPFQRPEWLLPWWHQFGQPKLRAVTVWRRGKLIAFLPFYIYSDSISKERQLLPLGVGTTDYLDGVFAPECGPEHVRQALDLLERESDWDILYAGQLRPVSLLFQTLRQTSGYRIQSFRGESCSRMRAVRLSELPVKIRRNAMYYRNRAMRLGTLELSDADVLNPSNLFEALVNLHTARWEDHGEPGVLADRWVLAWHREALPLLLKSGILRLCSLRLNGEIIGVLYSLIDPAGRPNRTQYFYLTGYSPEHANLRSGTLLLALAIERAAEEGVETIDMLRGEEEYKKIWHVERVPTYGFALQNAAHEGRWTAA
jgi:CelD/BcsL family acetyltransferase involved in cellulose biosynthesis